MSATEVVLRIGAIATGMMAGLLLVFSTTVMPSIERLAPADGLATMQSINRRITEPLFGLVFGGGVLASIAAIGLAFGDLSDRWMMLAAGLTYLIGFLGVTAVIHLPLNAALDRIDASSDGAAAATWPAAAVRWRRFNHLRATAAAVACILYVLAL